MTTTLKHVFTVLIGSISFLFAEGEAIKIGRSKKIAIYKQGDQPDGIEDIRDKWLKLLKRMPENARMSDFRALFSKAKSIGVKDIKSLNRETWEVDDTFFVVFEIRIEDFSLEDPRIANKPTLHSFTFVKKMPTLEEMLLCICSFSTPDVSGDSPITFAQNGG